MPAARRDQLIVRELEDEVLVYDMERQKAHCLNKTSAFVWKHCDGKTTLCEMTNLLKIEFAISVDDDVVWLALNQLRRFHLLEEGRGKLAAKKVSRRDLVRKYLPAALAVPLILSIAAPMAVHAASGCAGVGEDCTTKPCCPTLNCDGICFPP